MLKSSSFITTARRKWTDLSVSNQHAFAFQNDNKEILAFTFVFQGLLSLLQSTGFGGLGLKVQD